MRAPLLKRLDDLRSNFWFLPLVMATLGACLALLAGALDRSGWPPGLEAFGGGAVAPAGARSLLSTLAAACMTVAGVVFSVILVSLSLAASQLGPRILRNFLQRGGTQYVVGMLLGTFVYCLFALRGISVVGLEHDPQLVVLVGLMLGIASFIALISFIHRMVHFIQAPHALAAVSEELRDALCRALPERGEGAGDEDELPIWARAEEAPGTPARTARSGYVQAIDHEGFAEYLCEHEGRARFLVRPGAFVSEGQAVARVIAPRDAADLEGSVDRFLLIGPNRSAAQDPEFVLDQLVEVAIRALSPGINDSFTACAAIDRIGEGLRLAAARDLPSRIVCDPEGTPRVCVQRLEYEQLVAGAYRRIRQQVQRDVETSLRLLHTMASVGTVGPASAFAAALAAEARRIHETTRTDSLAADDVDALDAALSGALAALGGAG